MILNVSPPISVIIVTRNEETRLGRCLAALQGFDEVIVVDSASTDRTAEIAKSSCVRVENFIWNGQYPKKYGWCLEALKIKYDWILFIDADEVMTPALWSEIGQCDLSCAGYFIKGRYIIDGTFLHHGLKNNKLCLLHRHKFEFPVVDDLDIEGMGEIEGHYQPVLKAMHKGEKIGQLNNFLDHHIDNWVRWYARHERYARWEAEMDLRSAWPSENSARRRYMKWLFRRLPFRAAVAFLHSFFLKCGYRDGKAGFQFAAARYWYYNRISRETALLRANKSPVRRL